MSKIESRYDVVVIGAGIGGITAGAMLAKEGKKVLIVEAEMQAGGCARAWRRGPYTFDVADHLIMGCGADGPFGPGLIDSVLRHLGVRDRCEFIRMDAPMYVGQFPDFQLAAPGGREQFAEAHLRHFPDPAHGLRRLLELSSEITREVMSMPLKPGLFDLVRMPRRFPALFRYRNATMKDVIDAELPDARLRAVYETLWSWIGPPPAAASFLMWAMMMGFYIEDGAYYPRGGYQRFADAFVAGLEAAGGQLMLGTRVRRVLVANGHVRGVVLDNGDTITAPVVLSNIDALETFKTLLGPEIVPRRSLDHLRRLRVGLPVLALYTATDLDVRALGAEHDTTLFTGWDHDQCYASVARGELALLSILIPTLKDPSLAPAGQHLVILKSIAPPRQTDERVRADQMLELAERVLPGLRQHLVFVDDSAGPSKLHHLGPYAGWAMTADQAGLHRLPQKTPVHGLWLVGQWTRPGHGILPVVTSGIAAARLVLHASTSAPALPLAA
ncbi:MAG: phytoene desaturase family protein [Acidobacteriota bacterium]